MPKDHPSLRRHARIYFALTNKCNRSCPWCSVYASPEKSTELELERFAECFPTEGTFEVQLEGGEPTIHPQFWKFVERSLSEPRMQGLVLCTNGTRLPRDRVKLKSYLARFGPRLILKISINHYLLEKDAGLLDLASLLAEVKQDGFELIINVRRRKGVGDDDQWVVGLLEERDLLRFANVFFLQRYGLAKNQMDWEAPFVVHDQFTMVNPDGEIFGGDLVGRSEAMGRLE